MKVKDSDCKALLKREFLKHQIKLWGVISVIVLAYWEHLVDLKYLSLQDIIPLGLIPQICYISQSKEEKYWFCFQ